MPTGASSDLVPLRKVTKARLVRLKGEATYDELLRALLDRVPEAEILSVLRPAEPREARPRLPAKQLLVAQLAKRRWSAWIEDGKLERRGKRLYAWRESTATPREVRYRVAGRRGLAP